MKLVAVLVPSTSTAEVGTKFVPVTVIAVSEEPEATADGETELMEGGAGVGAGVGVAEGVGAGTKGFPLPPQPVVTISMIVHTAENRTSRAFISPLLSIALYKKTT